MNPAQDEALMRRCLELAKQAEGRSSPNPLVGAVVVDREGAVCGEGFHAKAGLAHAEVLALDAAGERAAGGTLYVNLEPCSHFGRTPPCADRVIASGVKRVVAGMQDPNPRVFGEGIAKLRAAGLTVEISSLEAECIELNRAFIKRIKTGLPWLALKMACSLDGRIADRHGKSRWITGAEARKYVHQLRDRFDCVLVGGTTAFMDDPELNVREIEGGRDPHRAVIDPSLQVTPQARLCSHRDGSESWTVIFSKAGRIKSAPAYPARVRLVDPLELYAGKADKEAGAGAEKKPDTVKDSSDNVMYDGNCINPDNDTILDEQGTAAGCGATLLAASLRWLAENDVQSVLCEGGGRLAAALIEEKLVDEFFWIIAPKFFTDSAAVPSLAGQLAVPVAECLELQSLSYEQIGRDLLIKGRPIWSKSCDSA